MPVNFGYDTAPYFTFTESLQDLGLVQNKEGQVGNGSLPGGDIAISYEVKSNKARLSAFWEAVHGAIRSEIVKELKKYGLVELYLPQGTFTRPKNERFVTVLITEPSKLLDKDHVIIAVNNHWNDLGALSWDFIIGEKQGVIKGSLVCLAQELFERGESAPGLVILNPGQLMWSSTQGKTISEESWKVQNHTAFGNDPPRRFNELVQLARPRHRRDISDEFLPEYLVSCNGSEKAHLKCAVDYVMNSSYVNDKARISVLAVGNEAGGEVSRSLQSCRDRFDLGWWAHRLGAIAWAGLDAPYQEEPGTDHPDFSKEMMYFMGWRTQAWVSSELPFGTLLNDLNNPDDILPSGCFNIMRYSSGEPKNIEAVVPLCYFHMLTFLEYKTQEEVQLPTWPTPDAPRGELLEPLESE